MSNIKPPPMPEPDRIDPETRIDMLRSWLAEADASNRLLQAHLSNVIEIAETWMPDYATKMDKDTIRYAKEALPPVGASLAAITKD